MPARSDPPAWWPWAVGAFLGLVVLGPGLGRGSLLSLDLLVSPHIPVPNGVFGLGPSLSQRVPLFALLGGLSALVGGPVAMKVFVVVCTAAAFAGAVRLTRLLAAGGPSPGLLGELAAGVLWAVGPFALTRLGAGHVNLLWVVAVLPWALPRLCRPADDPAATFLASLLLAVGGPAGGTLGLAAGLAALALQARRGRILRPLAALLVPHLVWLAPTAVLLWAGAGVAGAGGFATHLVGVAGWPAVVVGNGFWRWDFQAGATGVVGAVAGLVVGALAAVAGVATLRSVGPRSWRGTAVVVAAVGLALAVASAVPGIRALYDRASDLPVGAPLRESHRFLALWLVWAAPAAAVGAARVADRWRARVLVAVPLVVALAVSVGGWWGIGGRLEPVAYPPGWAVARQVIADRPGPVVALPWSEYPPLSFAGGRQVFNPVPEYLGGDVISSYDPVFDPDRPAQEQVDRRADAVDRLARRAQAGEPVGDDLARLGVRWVVLIHEAGWDRYHGLGFDPGLERALALPDVDLYRVRGWSGPAEGPDGTAHRLDRPVPPLLTTDAPAGSVLDVAGAPGWVQGWATPVAVTADGRLRLRGEAGVVWFWPAAVLLALDLSLVGATVVASRSRRDRFGRLLAHRVPRG